MVKVPLSKPDISALEKKYIIETLDSGQLSFGEKLYRFEAACAKTGGKKFAAAVNSGTSALHLAVRALGLKKGDEVITTPYSFIASSNCLLFEDVTPVFVDIDPYTLNMDPALIESAITNNTKAILVVHIFGQMAHMDEIQRIADKYNLKMIEDACEAIGASWNGRPAGSFGDLSVFAFYPNKQITTGEGGVLMTDDRMLYDTVCSLRNQGRSLQSEWLVHPLVGYNYRMSDLQAAIGLAQMERLSEILGKRDVAAQRYKVLLKESSVPVKFPRILEPCMMSWFVFVILLPEEINRSKVMERLAKKGIQSRPYFPSIHLQPAYQQRFGYKQGDFKITEKMSKRTLAVPFYSQITEEQQRVVVCELAEAIEKEY